MGDVGFCFREDMEKGYMRKEGGKGVEEMLSGGKKEGYEVVGVWG